MTSLTIAITKKIWKYDFMKHYVSNDNRFFAIHSQIDIFATNLNIVEHLATMQTSLHPRYV